MAQQLLFPWVGRREAGSAERRWNGHCVWRQGHRREVVPLQPLARRGPLGRYRLLQQLQHVLQLLGLSAHAPCGQLVRVSQVAVGVGPGQVVALHIQQVRRQPLSGQPAAWLSLIWSSGQL